MGASLSDLRHHLPCRNVYDSMEQYTKVELLEGENQYKAEGFGMQVTLALACCLKSSLQLACSISIVFKVQPMTCLWQGSIMHMATHSMLYSLQSALHQQSRGLQLGHKIVPP